MGIVVHLPGSEPNQWHLDSIGKLDSRSSDSHDAEKADYTGSMALEEGENDQKYGQRPVVWKEEIITQRSLARLAVARRGVQIKERAAGRDCNRSKYLQKGCALLVYSNFIQKYFLSGKFAKRISYLSFKICLESFFSDFL